MAANIIPQSQKNFLKTMKLSMRTAPKQPLGGAPPQSFSKSWQSI